MRRRYETCAWQPVVCAPLAWQKPVHTAHSTLHTKHPTAHPTPAPGYTLTGEPKMEGLIESVLPAFGPCLRDYWTILQVLPAVSTVATPDPSPPPFIAEQSILTCVHLHRSPRLHSTRIAQA